MINVAVNDVIACVAVVLLFSITLHILTATSLSLSKDLCVQHCEWESAQP